MKKISILLATLVIGTILTGCGISKDEFNSIQLEKDNIEKELASLKSSSEKLQEDYIVLQNECKELEKEYNALETEYNEYKEKMEPYEELEVAEAEARKIEAEKIKEEEEARKKAEAEEAEKQKEAEEKQGYETNVTYNQLARTPDDYLGKKVKFSGKVVQVIEGDGTVQIRLAVGSNYDTILFCEYDSKIVSSRVLEDDKITIYGKSVGLISYESTMGGTITIPGVSIDKIDQ